MIKIPEAVVHEIKIIGDKGKGKQKNLAQPALQFIRRYPQLSHGRYDAVDDAILHVASDLDAVVVTNDRLLRERLKEKRVSRIFLRGKQRLVLER